MSTRATTFDNVWNFLGGSFGLQGHEKAVKTAFYNALAMLLLVVCCAAVYALYFILDPFIKPLIWSVLLGSVLHPFKYSMVYYVKSWIDGVENKGTPISIAFIMIPVSAFDRLSDRIGDLIYRNRKTIFISSVTIPLFIFLYVYTPQTFIGFVWKLSNALHFMTNVFVTAISGPLLLTALICYTGLLVLWGSPDNTLKFSVMGFVMWCVTAGFIARLFGPSRQLAAFVIIQALCLLGYVYEKWTSSNAYKSSKERHQSLVEALMKTAVGSRKSSVSKHSTQSLSINSSEEKKHNIAKVNSDQGRKSEADGTFQGSTSSSDGDGQSDNDAHQQLPYQSTSLPITYTLSPVAVATLDSHRKLQGSHAPQPGVTPCEVDIISSERCLCVLGWTCLAVFLWSHIWLLHFLPITIVMYISKHVGHYFGLWNWTSEHLFTMTSNISQWCTARKDALCPTFLAGLLKIQTVLRLKLLQTLNDSVDTASSVLVILALLVFLLSTTIFISVNVYAEGIYIVQMAANVINNTLSNNQEVLALLPEGVLGTLHPLLDNAYLYGRQSIPNMVHAVLKNADADKTEELEQRVLELWDRIYHAWMTRGNAPGTIGPTVSSSAVYASWEHFLEGVQKTPELLNLDGILQFAQENVGMLSSLLESLWDILKGNISLLFQSSLTIFSIVLGGGSAVINFLISSVVFCTALFYLLRSSGSLYRPVELVASFSPSSGNQIATAIDGAVGDVFRASFKMAVFHGLWAWLIHTLFAVKVVYLPSVLAAVLGVVPFLGTYWACIPAVLEIWVVHGSSLLALIMVLAFYIPTSWVNGLIYEEIKGGHPYLTGLSVAGGVYCMGSEGAIFGPLLLCCVFVALNISSTLMEEPSLSHLSPMKIFRNMPPLRRRDTTGL